MRSKAFTRQYKMLTIRNSKIESLVAGHICHVPPEVTEVLNDVQIVSTLTDINTTDVFSYLLESSYQLKGMSYREVNPRVEGPKGCRGYTITIFEGDETSNLLVYKSLVKYNPKRIEVQHIKL